VGKPDRTFSPCEGGKRLRKGGCADVPWGGETSFSRYEKRKDRLAGNFCTPEIEKNSKTTTRRKRKKKGKEMFKNYPSKRREGCCLWGGMEKWKQIPQVRAHARFSGKGQVSN